MDLVLMVEWVGILTGKELAISLSHAYAFPSILPYFWPLVLKACLLSGPRESSACVLGSALRPGH